VKIAKSIVSEKNIAYVPGEYKNFTGKIVYEKIRSEVKNATFELKSNG